MTDAINISRLNKSYGSQTILNSVDVTVPRGSFTGLVGENGAGKTTLIKCILDFCSIDNGSIQLFGVDHRLTESREKLTCLPEKFIPPYYLTGEEFLRYMSELYGMQYNEVVAKNMLRVLDLADSALKKPVRQYSKGMGQKLGLASCFMSNRELMIFDEPMSGLDPKARALLKRHLLELKQQGRTLFYSTHLLEDIQSLCDQVVILHEGKICFSGSVAECCAVYKADDLETAYLTCAGESSTSQI